LALIFNARVSYVWVFSFIACFCPDITQKENTKYNLNKLPRPPSLIWIWVFQIATKFNGIHLEMQQDKTCTISFRLLITVDVFTK